MEEKLNDAVWKKKVLTSFGYRMIIQLSMTWLKLLHARNGAKRPQSVHANPMQWLVVAS